MATVYLWKRKLLKARIGHISLQLSDGTYISHWPSGTWRAHLTGASAKSASLQEDEEKERGKFDEKVEIPEDMIDLGKIKEWLEKDYPKYYLLDEQNCARVVHDAMRSGGLRIFNESSWAVAGLQVVDEDDTWETMDRKERAIEAIRAARDGAPLPKDIDVLKIMVPETVFALVKDAVKKGK